VIVPGESTLAHAMLISAPLIVVGSSRISSAAI